LTLFVAMYRACRAFLQARVPTRRLTIKFSPARPFSASLRKKDELKLPNRLDGNEVTDFEGTLARTDSTVQVEHPSESDLPKSEPVQGRGGVHHKRTLASFSLEGKVGLVTGGAQGLGLMMSQALIISGADLAIVDLDSE
jgi:D-arabinitol 2-dehydrogenase